MLQILLLLLYTLTATSYTIEGNVIKDLDLGGFLLNPQVESWTVTGAQQINCLSTCGNGTILGGYQIGGNLSTTYASLPAHDIVYFDFELFIIDNWTTSDAITIKFDPVSFNLTGIGASPPAYNSPWPSNLCGDPSIPDLGELQITGQALHNTSSLTLSFVGLISSPPSVASFGIKNIYLRFGFKQATDASNFCASPVTDPSVSLPFGCQCPYGFYSNSSSCNICNINCESCFGSLSNQCYACASSATYNGTNCIPCSSNCLTCAVSSTNCTSCPSSLYLLSNSTCSQTCHSYIPVSYQGSNKLCKSPCSANQYLNANGECVSSCSPPLQAINFGDSLICYNPCISSQYLLYNGTCTSQCNTPLVLSSQSGYSLCSPPCAPSQYFYLTGICSSTCPAPLKASIVNGFNICLNSCSSGAYLGDDGKCWPTCPWPFISNQQLYLYCESPCPIKNPIYNAETSTCVQSCYSPNYIEKINNLEVCQSNNEKAFSAAELNSVSGNVAKAAALAALVGSGSSFALFGLITLNKLLLYIRYINITYPTVVREYFALEPEPISLGFPFPAPDTLDSDLGYAKPPGLFEFYGTDSSFLMNYWSSLSSLINIMGAIIFIKVVSFCLKSYGYEKAANLVSNNLELLFRWNFFLLIFCNTFEEIIVFSWIEFNTTPMNSFLSCFSSLLATIAMAVAVLVVSLNINLVCGYQKVKGDNRTKKKFLNEWKSVRILFGGYKDKSALCQSFMLIFIFRVVIFNSALIFLTNYPIIQALISLFLSIGMITFILVKQPFAKRLIQFHQVVHEGIVLSVNICIVILAAYSSNDEAINSESETFLDNIGTFMITAFMVFSITALIFLCLDILFELYFSYRRSKRVERADSKVSLVRLFTIPLFRSAGMDISGSITNHSVEIVKIPKKYHSQSDDRVLSPIVIQKFRSLPMKNEVLVVEKPPLKSMVSRFRTYNRFDSLQTLLSAKRTEDLDDVETVTARSKHKFETILTLPQVEEE